MPLTSAFHNCSLGYGLISNPSLSAMDHTLLILQTLTILCWVLFILGCAMVGWG